MGRYVSCAKCNGLLTKRFVQRYGPECPDCNKPLGRKLYEVFGRRR